GDNIIVNPSLEEMDGETPKGWTKRTYGGQVEYAVSTEAKTGKRSLEIKSTAGVDGSWFTNVELRPNTEYRLSAWIKTEGVRGAHGALLNVHELQHKGKTNALQKRNDWTQVEKIFNSERGGNMSVNLLFGGWGMSTGTAWYDDVALQAMTPVFKKPSETPIVGDL
ncbi:MAG: carbohydrate binding domain-containing protein, partial [Verrucomicrobiota bacterium]